MGEDTAREGLVDTPKRMARFPLRAHALAAVSAHADAGALRTSAGSARGALPSWWLIVTPRGHAGYAQAKSMLFLTSGYTQSVAGGHRSHRPCLHHLLGSPRALRERNPGVAWAPADSARGSDVVGGAIFDEPHSGARLLA